ncbi:MAG: 3-isopropylmalate/(R)-2-methylmalate dehydratase small subunit [Gammaproteobacteria bacterium]|jgi:3-isopropylmalate/(R)-2-methylmalate dehydratase small subunit
MHIKGKTWKFGDHINTDLILPGPVMLLPFDEQPKYAFQANRPGWAEQVAQGDVIVGGHNFGTGSGRPAARSLKVLGVNCIIAESINGLFFRNCVNYGVYAMECPGISTLIEEGDEIAAEFGQFTVRNLRTGEVLHGKRFPDMLMDVIDAGGIYPMMEKKGMLADPNPETA